VPPAADLQAPRQVTLRLLPGCVGAVVFASSVAAGTPPKPAAPAPADLVLDSARVYTVSDGALWADAVAIRGGRIVYVGTSAGAAAYVGPKTERRDMGTRLILPALVDSHTHPGLVTSSGDVFLLPETEDPKALVAAVADEAKKHPEKKMLVGGYWPIAGFPTSGPRKEDLDRVVPDRPVVLFDDSGHSQWLNSKALAAMGIAKTTPDPVPGLSYFVRDASGEPTGWAKEMAVRPYLAKMGLVPRLDKQELFEFLTYLVSKGVTTLFDAGNGDRDDAVYSVLHELELEGRLPLRYHGCVHITLPDQVDGAVARLERLRAAYSGPRLRLDTIKIHFDGVSEIGTSSVLEPFVSDPKSRGGTVISGDRLRDFIVELDAKGIDLHLHTVGDAAVRTALDAVEAAQGRLGRGLKSRVTLCHIELVSNRDVPRFAKLGVIANFTPHWNGGYFLGADRHLGQERYDRMYRVQPLIDADAMVTFSSDITDHIEWKTERGNPFLGMEIGHNRQEGPDDPIRPEEKERLGLEALVRGYTRAGAYQLGREMDLGSIEPGKSADLIVLDTDLFTAPRYKIHEIAPSAVLMEGRVVSGKLP
jgi:predicted amidohydrolase YtcJ